MSESENFKSAENESYQNPEFERDFGDLLREGIRILFPLITEDGVEGEKDIFYYKLKVLQTLEDPSVVVGSPSTELTYAFGHGLNADEFEEFKKLIEYIIKQDPQSVRVLTSSLISVCDEVIADSEKVSFYFNFTAPNPKRIH